jgi:uncharacterized protein (TIGR00369 family)
MSIQAVPFALHMGFTLERFENGESELRYAPRPEHHNSFDVVHGGVSMALLDIALATAARSLQPESGVVTIEMKTSFMQAARGPLVARGRLMHRTTTLAFCEATVHDAEGRLCTHATGTFKYMRRLPAGDREVHELRTTG